MHSSRWARSCTHNVIQFRKCFCKKTTVRIPPTGSNSRWKKTHHHMSYIMGSSQNSQLLIGGFFWFIWVIYRVWNSLGPWIFSGSPWQKFTPFKLRDAQAAEKATSLCTKSPSCVCNLVRMMAIITESFDEPFRFAVNSAGTYEPDSFWTFTLAFDSFLGCPFFFEAFLPKFRCPLFPPADFSTSPLNSITCIIIIIIIIIIVIVMVLGRVTLLRTRLVLLWDRKRFRCLFLILWRTLGRHAMIKYIFSYI